MNADGSDQINLTNNPYGGLNPAWSPDGEKIAFMSRRVWQFGHDIYVMNADGSEQTSLTNNQANDYHPAWSPDGTKIAFDRLDPGPNSDHEIYVMNADGSGQTNRTNHPGDDGSPDWQPLVPDTTIPEVYEHEVVSYPFVLFFRWPSYRSSEPNSTFECKLDKGEAEGDWEACNTHNTEVGSGTWGFTTYYHLRFYYGWPPRPWPEPVEHTFSVRATDEAGNTDPTPAVETWVW